MGNLSLPHLSPSVSKIVLIYFGTVPTMWYFFLLSVICTFFVLSHWEISGMNISFNDEILSFIFR